MFNNKEIGLYIHIPFCKAKCFYCDFNSFAGKDELVPSYIEALKAELEYYKKKLNSCKIKSIFIGGGTPSLIETKHIFDLINWCKQNLNIESSAEITIEANPGTLDFDKLRSYKIMGINRLNIGLQAWQKNLLSKIGRIHSLEEFLQNYKQARKVGFKNINIDLIFGLPGQTLIDWKETIKNVLELEPEHVSCYSLKIEEGTPFGNCIETGELKEIDDELDREMYYHAKEMFKNQHLKHYEISNFAKQGLECRHNLIYWNQEEYIGIGAGAHSFFEGKRFNNIYEIEKYISFDFTKELPVENLCIIDEKEAISEFMILGLRLLDGISKKEFFSKFNRDLYETFGEQLDRLLKKKMINILEDKISLTSLGEDLANQVFVEFV